MPTFHNQETGKKYHVGLSDVFFSSRPRAGSRSNANVKQVRKRTSISGSSGGSAGNGASNSNPVKIDAIIKEQQDTVTKEDQKNHNEENEEKEAQSNRKKTAENVLEVVSKDEWTHEDESKLMKLKDDENKGWNEIAEALGRPKNQVTIKYGSLKKAAKAGRQGIDQRGKGFIDRNGDHKSEKTVEGRDSVRNGNEKIEALPPHFMISAIDPTDEVKLINMTKAVQVVEGEQLSMSEIINVCRMHDYFEHQKWVAIASELFSQTGKRITPESLRNTFFEAKLAK